MHPTTQTGPDNTRACPKFVGRSGKNPNENQQEKRDVKDDDNSNLV